MDRQVYLTKTVAYSAQKIRKVKTEGQKYHGGSLKKI